MRIIKCHIENFGMLKQRDISFSSGINEYFYENGKGKTTLAAFIRTMLYGMDDVKPKSKNNPHPFCERIHYFPFDRSKFGGSLDIEAEGKYWHIERFFDEKKSVNDSVKLLCDGEETETAKTMSIGEQILHIDKDSFERLLFIDRSDLEISASGSMGAKLNDMVDDGSIDFKKAKAEIEKLLKALKDGKGSVNKPRLKLLSEKINDIDQKKANAEEIVKNLEKMYAKRSELADAARLLQKKSDDAAKLNVERGYWNTYDGYIADAKNKAVRAEELQKGYPHGIPSEDELKTLENCASNDIELSARLKGAKMPEEDIDELERLKEVFESGIPGAEVLENIKQGVHRIKIIEDNSDNSRVYIPEKFKTELLPHFQNGVPSDEDIERIQAIADKFRERRREYESAKNTPPEPPKNGKTLPLGIAAAIFIIAGIAVLAAVNKTIGIVLIVLGVVFVIAAAAADFSARLNRLENSRDNAVLKTIEEEMAAAERQVAAFNAMYGYASEDSAVYDFEQLKNDADEYLEIKERIETEEKDRERLKVELKALKSSLDDTFALYGIRNADEMLAYEKLNDEIKALSALEKRMSESKKAEDEIKAEKAENDRIKNGIIEKYALDVSDGVASAVTLATKTSAEIAEILKTAEESVDKAEKLKLEKKLTVRPDGEDVDISEIQEELNEKQREIVDLDRQISDAEGYADVASDLKAQREACEEKKAEYEAIYSIYKKVGEYFDTAEKNLKGRYIDPVKNSYIAYASVLEEALGEKIEMDKEYRIMFEKNGEYRSEKHLSAGQLCICTLCFRLAVADNIFKDEKPFVIMDDPFGDLDSEHMQKAAGLMKKLAADRQIIYFCCHESRKIN